jgi:hypothetical protein
MNKNDMKTVFEQWKAETDDFKEIPRGLSKARETALINECWLIKKGKETWVSGGGRVLLFFVLSNGSWKKHLTKLEKAKRWNTYLEALQFQHRQKLLKVNLFAQLKRKNIDPLNIIEKGV